MTLLERIEARIERVPFSTCWYWVGGSNGEGYGQLSIDGRSRSVHRLLYEASIAKIPDGKELNHLCEIKCCCNPAHLEAVTHAENMLYSSRKRTWVHNSAANQTHCKHGHPLSGSNLRMACGKRRCVICNKKWQKEWRERSKPQESRP